MKLFQFNRYLLPSCVELIHSISKQSFKRSCPEIQLYYLLYKKTTTKKKRNKTANQLPSKKKSFSLWISSKCFRDHFLANTK